MSLWRPAVTLSGVAPAPPRATYDRFVAVDLPALITGYGPLPGAAAVRPGTGVWGDVGSSRTVVFTDGAAATERVLTAERPDETDAGPRSSGRFVYRVSDYTNALRRFASHADGDWRFAPDGRGGTQITWTYSFTPRSAPLALPLWPVVAGPVRGYMKRVLATFIAGAA